jgi:amidase
MKRQRAWLSLAVLIASCILPCQSPSAGVSPNITLVETTISQIHQALRSGRLSCRQLVTEYLARIQRYDQSTRLNAIVVVNPAALADADRLDKELKRTGKLRPLHGVPVIVKDNYDTAELTMHTRSGGCVRPVPLCSQNLIWRSGLLVRSSRLAQSPE